jgi:hypothetical protein
LFHAFVQKHEADTGQAPPKLKDLKVGAPLPPIEKYVEGKWRPFQESRDRRHLYSTHIFVQGMDKGKRLEHFKGPGINPWRSRA